MCFETKIENHIAEVVFNKPPVNAFDSNEWAAIAAEIKNLGENESVRVIVIRAEGRGFCAGADLGGNEFLATGLRCKSAAYRRSCIATMSN